MARGHGRSHQHRPMKCEREGERSHATALNAGGPRMCGARGKILMMSIGAPQCWHTNVGGLDPALRESESTGGAGAGTCNWARATSMFFLRVGLASSP